MVFIDKLIKKYKDSESLFSMVLGVLVVLVVGNQVIGFINMNVTKNSKPIENSVEAPAIDQQDQTVYVVKKGDYLYKITANLLGDGNKWPMIALANNITNPDIITEGDKLIIPNKTTISASATKTNGSIVDDKYTVVANDNLWTICVRAYGDGYQWPKVAKVNNLKSPDLLEKGQILTIPR